jgi:hypothetical protein
MAVAWSDSSPDKVTDENQADRSQGAGQEGNKPLQINGFIHTAPSGQPLLAHLSSGTLPLRPAKARPKFGLNRPDLALIHEALMATSQSIPH